MKYVVLPVYDTDPSAPPVWAVLYLRSYVSPIFCGPFFTEQSAHEAARTGEARNVTVPA